MRSIRALAHEVVTAPQPAGRSPVAPAPLVVDAAAGAGRGALAVGVLAAVLGGATIGREPLWNDEIASLALVGRPFGDLAREIPGDHNGALFHLVLWPVVQLGGSSSALLRLPALVAFVAAAVICALVGARLAGRRAGLAAGTLLAVNPFAIAYGQEARMYAFALCFSLLAVLALQRATEVPTRRRWLLYAASVVAMGYSHDFALLTVLAHPLLLARPLPWRQFVGSLGLAAAGLVPLVLIAAHDSGSDPLWWLSAPGPGALLDTARTVTGSWAGLAVVAALLATAAAAGVRRRLAGRLGQQSVGLGATVVWLVGPVILLFLVSQAKPVYVDRYVVPGAAALCLLVALSARLLPARASLPALAATAVAFFAATIHDAVSLEKPDWPAVVAFSQSGGRGDLRIVTVGNPGNSANALIYYDPSYGVPRDRLIVGRDAERRPDRLRPLADGHELQVLDAAATGRPGLLLVQNGVVDARQRALVDEWAGGCGSSRRTLFRDVAVTELRGCGSPGQARGSG